MSHEIRTPLYGMLGTLELLSLSALTDLQRQQIATMQSSSAVLLQLLDDLLAFSRIQAGQIDLDAVPFDPVELVEWVARAQSPLALRKGLALACYLQPGLPWVVGDPVRVRQVLANLLGNALKFTVQGRVTIRMGCASAAADRVCLMLEVADTGIGIPPEVQPCLFEPFVQGDVGGDQHRADRHARHEQGDPAGRIDDGAGELPVILLRCTEKKPDRVSGFFACSGRIDLPHRLRLA